MSSRSGHGILIYPKGLPSKRSFVHVSDSIWNSSLLRKNNCMLKERDGRLRLAQDRVISRQILRRRHGGRVVDSANCFLAARPNPILWQTGMMLRGRKLKSSTRPVLR